MGSALNVAKAEECLVNQKAKCEITLTKSARQLAIQEIMELKREREEQDLIIKRHYSLFDKIAKDFEVNGDLKYF